MGAVREVDLTSDEVNRRGRLPEGCFRDCHAANGRPIPDRHAPRDARCQPPSLASLDRRAYELAVVASCPTRCQWSFADVADVVEAKPSDVGSSWLTRGRLGLRARSMGLSLSKKQMEVPLAGETCVQLLDRLVLRFVTLWNLRLDIPSTHSPQMPE